MGSVHDLVGVDGEVNGATMVVMWCDGGVNGNVDGNDVGIHDFLFLEHFHVKSPHKINYEECGKNFEMENYYYILRIENADTRNQTNENTLRALAALKPRGAAARVS